MGRITGETRARLFVALLMVIGSGIGCNPPRPGHTDSLSASADSSVRGPIGEIGREITITGRLINTGCYASAMPEFHDESDACAAENSRKGMPVAVSEEGKPVSESWILLVNPRLFTDYMNQTVQVDGEIRGEGVLLPNRIEMAVENGWMFIM